MLPKSHRLPATLRLTQARTLKLPLFIVKYAPSAHKSPRFGVVISKKIDKRATGRNRMRRLLHTFIDSHLSQFPQNYDYLFLVQRPFEELDGTAQEELVSQLSQI